MARKAKASDLEPTNVGNDDHDDEPVAVVRGSRLRAAFVPASVSRLDDDQVAILADLQHVVLEIADRQDAVARLVADARSEGCSWAAIGWSIGTSGEAARQRFGSDE